MLVDEEDRPALKDWIVPKLEKISEADAGVLADYVIALIVADETADEVRQTCLTLLSDFLLDNTAPFIDEVLSAVANKSFAPRPIPTVSLEPTLLPSPALSAEAPPFHPPTGPSALSRPQPRLPGLGIGSFAPGGDQPRKRRYNERESSQPENGTDLHYARGPGAERPSKQPALRGGRNSRGGPGGQYANANRMPFGVAGGMQNGPLPYFPVLPTPPPQFPAFDPTDPMAFIKMMGMAFPGMANLPSSAMQPPVQKGRCKDYDTKGYCAIGSQCPYEHGGEIVLAPSTDGTSNSLFATSTLVARRLNKHANTKGVADNGKSDKPPEYDPNQASLAMEGLNGNSNQSRGRSGPTVTNGPRTRAPYSQLGPTYDTSRTTVVVEQIPEESFTEAAIRDYFSQFGTIVDVDMQAYKRLAVIKFEDYSAARRAYSSPQAIFNNRFVKVYWYKPDSLPTPPTGAAVDKSSVSEAPVPYKKDGDAEMIDLAEVEARQAEAQKSFEERQKKAQEAAVRMEEIEKKIQANQEQQSILRMQLANKAAGSLKSDGNALDSSNGATLMDQLSQLQAEAQNLNADGDTQAPRGRGQGASFRGELSRGASYRGTGYRSRGSYPQWSRGYAASRGGYRGRGYSAVPYAGGRSSVKRLDNRPKRIAVSGVEAGSKKDEALRQFLLNHYECDGIEPHPDGGDTQIISFKERYMAEMFLDHSHDIPDVGKVELSWVPNGVAATKANPTVSDHQGSDGDKFADANAEEHTTSKAQALADETNEDANGDADYDVADDEDRWKA